MKKRICLLICFALTLAFAGCGIGPSGKTGDRPAGVNDVLQQGMAEADGKKHDTSDQAPEGGIVNDPQSTDDPAAVGTETMPDGQFDGIDVDLTVLSSTMVYSEVYSMMVSPEDYIGKTVRMKGRFTVYHDEASGNYYFACIIRDAAACCAQGIEFILKGEHKYPDDYPEEGAEICVTGLFDTYREGDYTYCTLRDAELR